MASFTNPTCSKASRTGNDHIASVTVTAGAGEVIGNVHVIIFTTGAESWNLLNLQDGQYVTASAQPPGGTSPPYQAKFDAEVTKHEQSATVDVGGPP